MPPPAPRSSAVDTRLGAPSAAPRDHDGDRSDGDRNQGSSGMGGDPPAVEAGDEQSSRHESRPTRHGHPIPPGRRPQRGTGTGNRRSRSDHSGRSPPPRKPAAAMRSPPPKRRRIPAAREAGHRRQHPPQAPIRAPQRSPMPPRTPPWRRPSRRPTARHPHRRGCCRPGTSTHKGSRWPPRSSAPGCRSRRRAGRCRTLR